MSSEVLRYFIGDIYAGDTGFGFLVADGSSSATDPTIDEQTARAIVAEAGGEPNAALSTANIFEISREEFELYRDGKMSLPDLPEGITIWQVKR